MFFELTDASDRLTRIFSCLHQRQMRPSSLPNRESSCFFLLMRWQVNGGYRRHSDTHGFVLDALGNNMWILWCLPNCSSWLLGRVRVIDDEGSRVQGADVLRGNIRHVKCEVSESQPAISRFYGRLHSVSNIRGPISCHIDL